MQTTNTLSNNNALTILIIDDDELILDSLTELLEVEGFQLYTAKSTAEGIAKISNGVRPNIIIVDYRMRGQSGVEAIRSVRRFMGEEVPAIIFTGDTSGEEIEVANLNRCSVLRKPHDVEALPNRINEMAA